MRQPFPLGLIEFGRRFPTDDACRTYMRDLRWPRGFTCPECPKGRKAYWLPSRDVLECAACKAQITLTAGTTMHKSKTSLCTWFLGAYLQATSTPGISALQFQRQGRIRRYETAFQMLHKMRAMLRQEERLSGTVEVDETYIGGYQKGAKGRGVGKATVVAAVEVRGRYAGKVRLKKIRSASRFELHPFVYEAVMPGGTVVTDGWQQYQGLRGYRHEAIVKGELPHVHRVFSNLKTWLAGTHHGVSKKHLQAYLNEFAFRFNRRHDVAAAFHAMLGLTTWTKGPTYRQIYSGRVAGGL